MLNAVTETRARGAMMGTLSVKTDPHACVSMERQLCIKCLK